MNTKFFIGKDLKTGEVFAEDFGFLFLGQMSISDLETAPANENTVDVVDTETGEVLETGKVVDLRKAAL